MTQLARLKNRNGLDVMRIISHLLTREENVLVLGPTDPNDTIEQTSDFPDALAKRVSIVHANGGLREVAGAIESQLGVKLGDEFGKRPK